MEEKEEKDKKRKKTASKGAKDKDRSKIIAVMFVPCTREGELLRRLREAEMELGIQTGIKLKIVERVVTMIVNDLHKARPWQGEDCRR